MARVFFVLTNIILGISISSSPSLAELIDSTSNDDASTSDDIHFMPRGLLIYFMSIYHGQFTEEAMTNYYNFANNYYYRTDLLQKQRDQNTTIRDKIDRREAIDSFDNVSVPDTVWSLDVSTGVHLEINSDEFDSDLLSGYPKAIHAWGQEILDHWINDTIYHDVILATPPQLQIASCEWLAERRDLDHCKPNDSQFTSIISNSNSTAQVVSSYNGSTSTSKTSVGGQQTQLGTMLIMPADLNISYGELIDVGTLVDLCDGVSSCAIIDTWYLDDWPNFAGEIDPGTGSIESPIAPFEPSIAPIDSPTPLDLPPPTISIGDPLPGPGPTPPITSPAIPETSSWIMITIGFGFIVAAGKRRAIHSTKQAVVRTVLKFTKPPFHRDTA